MIHHFACLWILIREFKSRYGWEETIEFSAENEFVIYWESWYLVTTTISTVGYGDYKAYNNTTTQWAPEMVFLTFVIVAGILLFSSVTNEIFAYKEVDRIETITMVKKRKMEEFLYEVQSVKENVFFPAEIHDNVLDSIQD